MKFWDVFNPSGITFWTQKGVQFDNQNIKKFSAKDLTVFWENYIEFIRDIDKYKYGRINYSALKSYDSGIIVDVDIYHKDANIQYIHLIRQLIKELCDFIFDTFIVEITGMDINRELLEETAIVLIRKQAVLDTETNLYRHGFHIYLHEYKMQHNDKKYIAKHFKLSDNLVAKVMSELPDTNINQFFDSAPLYGTTQLPLLFENQYKVYESFIDKNNEVLPVWDDELILERLNPFNGISITVKKQLIKNKQTLLSVLNNYHPDNYLTSVILIYQVLTERIQDCQFLEIIKTFKRPIFQYRQSIMACLVGFLDDIYLAQQAMYIIMCEDFQEGIQQIDDIREINESQTLQGYLKEINMYEANTSAYINWLEAYKDRARGPQQIEEYNIVAVGSQIENYKRFVNIYNNIHQQDLDYSFSFFAYGKFHTHLKMYQQGQYYKDFFTHIVNDQQNKLQAENCFMSFITYQVLNEFIYFEDMIYVYEEEILLNKQDYNKYKEYKEGNNKLQVMCLIYVEEFINQIIAQQRNFLQMSPYFSIFTSSKQNNKKFLSDKKNPPKFALREFVQQYTTIDNLNKILISIKKQIQVKPFLDGLKQIKAQQNMGNSGISVDAVNEVFGVYNGLIQFYSKEKKIKFFKDKDVYVSKSTTFKIMQECIDQDGFLITQINQTRLSQRYKDIYLEVKKSFQDIYPQEDLEILQFKIYQIVYRMFYKNIDAEHLIISYGKGSDGKTTSMSSILQAIGFNGCKLQDRCVTSGYGSQTKAAILLDVSKNSNQHDTGGLAELNGCCFALVSELSQELPLSTSQVKNLFAGTQIQTRAIFGKNIITFTNKSEIELQTNFYPSFDAPLDDGFKRRVLFYKHSIKFVSQQDYDKISDEKKQYYRIGNSEIRTKLTTDMQYVDMIGYFLLITFLKYKHDIQYIPQLLITESARFFQKDYINLPKLIGLLSDATGISISWKLYDKTVVQTLGGLKDNKNRKAQIDVANHINQLKNHFINDIYIINKKTQERKEIVINEFDQYQNDDTYIILINNKKFVDQTTQLENEEILAKYL